MKTKSSVAGTPTLDLRRGLRQLLRAYAKEVGCTDSAAIRDALTDLQHICDAQGLDFIERPAAASEVYAEELLAALR